jgi:hypothetical protein
VGSLENLVGVRRGRSAIYIWAGWAFAAALFAALLWNAGGNSSRGESVKPLLAK